jgi:RND family efflux transporter MFP subunit
VLLVALAACSRSGSEPQLEDVKRGDLVVSVEVTGELAAVDSTDLNPPILQSTWDFKVSELVAEGSDVKAGDTLARFDTSNVMRDLEKVQANAEEARTKLTKKRDEATLAKKNAELDVATHEADLEKKKLEAQVPADLRASIDAKTALLEVESAQLLLDGSKHKAEQQIRSDQAEIRTLEESLADATKRVDLLQKDIPNMRVVAPRAGTLVYPISRWRSEKVKVDDPVWRGMVILQVVALGNMIGKGSVDEVDSARVSEKQPVSLRLDALPDVQLHGKIQRILPALHAKSAADPSKVVDLELTIDPEKDAPLRPGMRFRGQVEIEHIKDALQVPTDAVFVTPDGPVAYVERGGRLEKTRVELGHRNANAIEVKSGLAAGDRVSRSLP